MEQAHLVISGRVQGVFYRASCQEVAIMHGLKGWARNLITGEVEVIVQGERDKIEKLIEWCKKGPPGANVSNIKVKWENVSEQYLSFEIK